MSGGGKTQVIYWTAEVVNNDSELGYAVIEQQFNQPLVDKATDYILAVERFQVNLNGVPFYDLSDNLDFIALTGFVGPTVINEQIYVSSSLPSVAPQTQIYSFMQLIEQLQAQITANPTLTNTVGLTINVDSYGFVYFEWTGDYTAISIDIPSKLNRVLGFEVSISAVPGPGGYWYSRYPRYDIGDICEHVRLVSNLMLVSDTAGQAKTNIVTDVANLTSYQSTINGFVSQGGSTSFTFTPRQKLTYQPNERRWLNFAAPVPISFIRIQAEYVDADGNSSIIPLPRGGAFCIKLGFYYRQ